MRRTKLLLLAVGVSALVATSIAAASHRKHAQTADVAATFTATASRTTTRTCTGEGNTVFTVTNAVWRGTATSTEPRLAGTLVLRTHAVVNNATGDGWLSGSWHSRNAPSGRAHAHLSAVIDNGSAVEGLATGRVHRPAGHLRGNFSAAIAGNTMSGSLGAGTSDNSAIIFRTGCKRDK
jgi:hypothetical protein